MHINITYSPQRYNVHMIREEEESHMMKLTKVGASGKERGVIMSLKSLLHVGLVTCVVFAVLVLFCVQTKRAISSQRLDADVASRVRISHIVKIGMELEAYIKDAQVRARKEDQFVERVNELEEKLRFSTTQKFDIAFDFFEAELKKAIGSDIFESEITKNKISVSRGLILKLIDDTIGDFGNELEKLNKAFEMERGGENRDQAEIENLEKVRGIVREALSEAGVSSAFDDGNSNEVADKDENELSIMLRNFFQRAKDAYVKSAQINLSEEKRDALETNLNDFENRNADEVVKDLTRILFPPGRQEQTSVYGIPTYNGGSVESWIEEILFLNTFNQETWPVLSEMENQWKGNRRRSADILKELNGMVLKGTVPAVWFVVM